MQQIVFLEECTIAKFPAEPSVIKYTSRDRKHTFSANCSFEIKSFTEKNGFLELIFNRPVNNNYRWYVPKEYVEKVKIIDSRSIICS